MSQIPGQVIDPIFNERGLNEDELNQIEALVASPIFGSLRRMMRLQISATLSELIVNRNSTEVAQLQGRIQGLRMLENMPVILAEASKKLREKEKKKEKQAKPKGRASVSNP